MISYIDKATCLVVLRNIVKTIEENEEQLTELDSAIGDGHHGVNLNRGFQVIIEALPDYKDKDIPGLLNDVGNILLETVGGSVGVLYGSAIIKAGTALGSKNQIDLDDLVRMVIAAEDGIKSLGHAEVGDKTMIDTIHPFQEALREASEKKMSLADALEFSVEAAKRGLESTKDMVATKGRAKYLGEKTRGHQDVGATSAYLMMEALLKTIKEIE